MQKIEVKIKKLHPEAKIPTYGSDQSAGFDIYAIDNLDIQPKETKKIPTGLAFELSENYHLQIWNRSSFGSKGIHHSAGIVDSDYRGELSIILHNSTNEVFKIEKGHRIAQVLVIPAIQANFTETETLNETQRGTGGFGSTGK